MSNEQEDIRELDKLLRDIFGPRVCIGKCTVQPLIGPGENYGSLMYRISADIHEIGSRVTQLQLVGKASPRNIAIKKIFNTPVTFKNEIAMYHIVYPTLVEFQQIQGVVDVISCYPKYFGARISLNSESYEVDDDAVILLENLKLSGFSIFERMKGFDVDITKSILRDLAVFHAVPIAIKLTAPHIFNTKIMPHLNTLYPPEAFSKGVDQSLIDNALKTAKLHEDCVPLIQGVTTAIELCLEYRASMQAPPEPFGTIIHDDLWVNNIMLKIPNKKNRLECKIVDYQTITYGSPGSDIIFFLYSSVPDGLLQMHFDEFIKCYYQAFIGTLKRLECNIAPFSYQSFLNDIEKAAKLQLWHILYMLEPIFAHKGTAVDICVVEENTRADCVSEKYSQRVAEVILDFAKRNWI